MIRVQSEAMNNDAHPTWELLRGLTGWTARKRMLASTSMYAAFGQFQLRFKRRFQGALGLLAEAIDSATTDSRRRLLQRWVFSSNADCCLSRGLADHIRRRLIRPEDLQRPDIVDLITSALQHCPIDNITNENRFARHNTHKSSMQGRENEKCRDIQTP